MFLNLRSPNPFMFIIKSHILWIGEVMDVALVITGHREGPWLKTAIESALRNKLNISETANVYVFLDRPDETTIEAARSFGASVTIFEVEFGDICRVRNNAVSVLKEKYLAFLDGDDLWGDSWLSSCIAKVRSSPSGSDFILHPQLTYCFGSSGIESQVVMEHIDSESPEFNSFELISSNFWSALAFAPKSVFQRFPYISSSSKLALGFEDWTFNIQTLAAGIPHKVLPETVHFIRRKEKGSRVKEESSRGATFYPSDLWLGGPPSQ